MGRIWEFDKIVFKPFSIRIGNIEATNFLNVNGVIKPTQSHINKNFSFFEILKWEPNPYFGKQDDYELDGFGETWKLKDGSSSVGLVGESFFTRQESCYMLAHFVDLDHDEVSPELQFCGGRPFDLSDEEIKNFIQVSKICYGNIQDQINLFLKEIY
jgi:hypothetical protein